MTTIAFLQNQWFRDPVRAREVYARNPSQREELNRRFLFSGCLTGRRLETAFGVPQCNDIIWEEISKNIGGHSNSSFPGDQYHIDDAIQKHRPGIILVFGLLAKEALQRWSNNFMESHRVEPLPVIIYGPHPAARHAEVMHELWEMNEELIFKLHDVFGIDINGRYDYSPRNESSESACV